jgi:hypothetical protein
MISSPKKAFIPYKTSPFLVEGKEGRTEGALDVFVSPVTDPKITKGQRLFELWKTHHLQQQYCG